MSSNVSTPSVTFFRHLSISPVHDECEHSHAEKEKIERKKEIGYKLSSIDVCNSDSQIDLLILHLTFHIFQEFFS